MMNRICLLLTAFMLLVPVTKVLAAETEIITEPSQVIEIESAGGAVMVQKQPANTPQKQVIKIKKSGGFLLIQINGKVKNNKVKEGK